MKDFPFVDKNGRLYFCSKGHPGYGGFDIFFTERDESGNWTMPQNLGQPINSPLDDISIFINDDEISGMFTSSRGGGDDDIFFFTVMDEPIMDEPLADIVPVSNDSSEKYINKKPSVIHQEIKEVEPEIVEEVIEEEPDPVIEEPTTEIIPDEELSMAEKGGEAEPEIDLTIEEILKEEEPVVQEETPTQASSIFFEIPAKAPQPEIEEKEVAPTTSAFANDLFTFQEFKDRAGDDILREGQIFRINGAIFDPNIWQLTPKVSKKLDELVNVLFAHPELKIEIGAHTESLGALDQNLEISKYRAQMTLQYLLKEGIPEEQISGDGYGEAFLLNHCKDGINCSMDEHLFNQRLEIRVVDGVEN